MSFKNEYVPPRDKEGAIDFIQRTLAESRSSGEIRQFPHPLEHYSAHVHHLNEFVLDAREKLRTGYSIWDLWTIDHEREMVLVHLGWPRRDPEDEPNACSWNFIDRTGHYRLSTTQASYSEISPGELSVTYWIHSFCRENERSIEEHTSLDCAKEAIDEYHRYSLFNFDAYPKRQITFIDCRPFSFVMTR